jgi:apolipoprotein D and lipocalin family protein
MSALRFFAIILIGLVAIRCEFKTGGCPKIQYELNSFELNRYLGKWYELAREKSIPFQKTDCTNAVYSLNDDGTIKVLNSGVVSGKVRSAVGRAETTENPFKLKISFSDSFSGKLFKGDYQVVNTDNDGGYQVVNTDYDGFSIVYSCTDLFFSRVEYYWILSRTREVSAEKLDGLTSYVEKKFGTTKDNLRFNNQSEEACRLY